jgi:hypothetical protein
MPFRFTIRDLFWLTLVIALVVAWWLDRRSLPRQSATEFNALRERLIDASNRIVEPIQSGATVDPTGALFSGPRQSLVTSRYDVEIPPPKTSP